MTERISTATGAVNVDCATDSVTGLETDANGRSRVPGGRGQSRSPAGLLPRVKLDVEPDDPLKLDDPTLIDKPARIDGGDIHGPPRRHSFNAFCPMEHEGSMRWIIGDAFGPLPEGACSRLR